MVEEIIRMREEEGKTFAKIAAELGITKDSAQKLYRRHSPTSLQRLTKPAGPGYPTHTLAIPDPKGWEKGFRLENGTGEVGSGRLAQGEKPDWEKVFRELDMDPALYEIIEPVNVRTWDANLGEGNVRRFWYYKANFRLRRDADDRVDVEQLKTEIRDHVPYDFRSGAVEDLDLNAVLTDWQLGKRDGDGTKGIVKRVLAGTDQLVERIAELRRMGRSIESVTLADLGDLMEGCDGHYCVAADTPILTDDLRWVPAWALRPGDGLYAFSEDADGPRGRRYRKGQVLANKVEELDAVRVTFEDGSHLVCTPEHPLLTAGGNLKQGLSVWSRADRLRSGVRVAKISDPWPDGETFSQGWLGGLYDGEGHFSAGRSRSAPNILGLAQKPGPVLDLAKEILEDHGFAFGERTNHGVSTLRIRGGYPECLRLLGTVRPRRLLAKVGEPYMQSTWVRVTKVESVGKQKIARLGTSTHTYFANGFASHNSMQTFEVEMDRRTQMKVARRLLLNMVKALAPHVNRIRIPVTTSNHGEHRRAGKLFTSWGDNDDIAVAEQVAEILQENSAYDHCSFIIGSNEMDVTMDVAGTITTYAHGHQMKHGVEAWWKGMALGRQPAMDSVLLVNGHRHHLEVIDYGARTAITAPSLESDSAWYRTSTGTPGRPGLLTLLVGGGDWRDLQVLPC